MMNDDSEICKGNDDDDDDDDDKPITNHG